MKGHELFVVSFVAAVLAIGVIVPIMRRGGLKPLAV